MTTSTEQKEEFLQLARNYVKNSLLECEPCEGYLEKKSPNLFIKWQVSLISLKFIADKIFCDEKYAPILLQE